MIRIYCEAADAVLKETQTLTAGMTNYPECVLTFSDDWDGFGKAVVVRAGEVEKSVLVVNNKFTVPHECLADSGVNLIVGVSGTNGVQTIPTIWCSCGTIMDSVDIDESAGTGTATQSLVDQMIAYAQEISDYAEDLDQNVIRSVSADNTNANQYGSASVGITDSGASANRTLTFTFANLKGRGIEEMIFIPDGANKNRLQIKFSDNTYLNYDGIKEAIASMDSKESAIEAAEALRVAAEQLRVSAESARALDETNMANAEADRATAESNRASAESGRASAESSRVTAESNRSSAESTRASNEQTRIANETTRQDNETTRQSNESGRVAAEDGRVDAEAARVIAESARAEEITNLKSAMAQGIRSNYPTIYFPASKAAKGSIRGVTIQDNHIYGSVIGDSNIVITGNENLPPTLTGFSQLPDEYYSIYLTQGTYKLHIMKEYAAYTPNARINGCYIAPKTTKQATQYAINPNNTNIYQEAISTWNIPSDDFYAVKIYFPDATPLDIHFWLTKES